MSEYGIYSTETGGLIYGIGFFDSEEEAKDCAEYCTESDGIQNDSWYLSTR